MRGRDHAVRKAGHAGRIRCGARGDDQNDPVPKHATARGAMAKNDPVPKRTQTHHPGRGG